MHVFLELPFLSVQLSVTYNTKCAIYCLDIKELPHPMISWNV